MKKIKIEKEKTGVEYMSLDEFSRWMCLVEAFYFIETKAKERGIVDIFALVKPMVIEKYIEERFPSIRHDVGVEFMLGNI